MPLKDVTELKPIIDKMVKLLYGKSMENIEIMKADQFPLSVEPKQGWLVHARFNDDVYEYTVQMYIQAVDGRITKSVELYRTSLGK